MPAPDQYWTDAASIGPVPARCWHVTTCLRGTSNNSFPSADYILGTHKLYLYLQKMSEFGNIFYWKMFMRNQYWFEEWLGANIVPSRFSKQ